MLGSRKKKGKNELNLPEQAEPQIQGQEQGDFEALVPNEEFKALSVCDEEEGERTQLDGPEQGQGSSSEAFIELVPARNLLSLYPMSTLIRNYGTCDLMEARFRAMLLLVEYESVLGPLEGVNKNQGLSISEAESLLLTEAEKQWEEVEYLQEKLEVNSLSEEQFLALNSIKTPGRDFGEAKKISKLLNQINEDIIRKQIDISRLRGSSILYLGRCHLTRFPKEILKDNDLQKYWEGLKELKIDSRNISKFPDELKILKNLEELAIFRSKCTVIPVVVFKMHSLKSLSFRGYAISELSENIVALKNLENLDLYGNQLTKLPSSISQMQRLENIGLGKNLFVEFPEEVTFLPRLKTLDLGHNQIVQIPKIIERLNELKYLCLSYNKITSIPPEMTSLKLLKSLNLLGNLLTENATAYLWRLGSLEKLGLSYNQFTQVPNDIARLQKLKQFWCAGNNLSKIPSTIVELQALDEVVLSDNRIAEISFSLWSFLSERCDDDWISEVRVIPDEEIEPSSESISNGRKSRP